MTVHRTLQKLALALATLVLAGAALAQQPLRQKLEYDLISPQR